MISNLNDIFSEISNNTKKSAIREILKLTQKTDIISFAGGLPAPESFPVNDLQGITSNVLAKDGPAALQYDATEGLKELREALVQQYQKDGVSCDKNNLIITTASQQGLDLLGKIFINPGDEIICSLPSYLGGISAFASYGAEMLGIPLDKNGMRSDILEETLERLHKVGKKPKFIYIIPDFQNPTGITMPEWRRIEIIQLAHKYNVLIVEDSPYREIRFEGKSQKLMYQLDNTGHVITLGTFSKILAPGFRIGWVLAHPEINDKLVSAKQSADLCTPTFVQKIVAEYIALGLLEINLQKTIDLYRKRRDAMLKGLKEYMPQEVTWTTPEGGLFLFLTLPDYINAQSLFYKAIEKKVAFVIGSVFFCNGQGRNTMRLNFTYVNNEKITKGVKSLSEVIKENIKQHKKKNNVKTVQKEYFS